MAPKDLAGRIEVPRSISEAPTDRLRVSVVIPDSAGNQSRERLIPGARAPTVGQSAGDGNTRSPANYLMGARAQQNQQTTIQVVMRALVGTVHFDFLDQAARDEDNITLYFRTQGEIQAMFPASKGGFAVGASGAVGSAVADLSEITGAQGDGQHAAAEFTLGSEAEEDTKVHIDQGGVLVAVAAGTTKSSKIIAAEDVVLIGPSFLVVSDILYDADGDNPKMFTKGRAAIANWPTKAGPAFAPEPVVAYCDQSVEWSAQGDVQGFQPGFGEDSSLYTLDVTLTEAMPRAKVIHPADADKGNLAYA